MLGDLFLEDYHYAFNINREDYINFKANNKHNAKHDAIVIRKLHDMIKRGYEKLAVTKKSVEKDERNDTSR